MKRIFTESDFESFSDFHDRPWINHLLQETQGTPIESEVQEFATHWWGTARAFILPWLLVDGIVQFADGALPTHHLTRQEVWDQYLGLDGFNVAIWKLAEGCYGACYYAYENLLTSLINRGASKSIRVIDRDFNALLAERFGQSLADSVWLHSDIAVARQVRNCLVHRGGRADSRLLKMRPLPMIEDSEILISASDVRQLHHILKPRVSAIVEHELTK